MLRAQAGLQGSAAEAGEVEGPPPPPPPLLAAVRPPAALSRGAPRSACFRSGCEVVSAGTPAPQRAGREQCRRSPLLGPAGWCVWRAGANNTASKCSAVNGVAYNRDRAANAELAFSPPPFHPISAFPFQSFTLHVTKSLRSIARGPQGSGPLHNAEWLWSRLGRICKLCSMRGEVNWSSWQAARPERGPSLP